MLLLSTCVVLAACSTAPGKPDPAEEDTAEATALPPGPITENPYLRRTPNVSAAARELFEQAAAAMDNGDLARAEELFTVMTQRHPRLSGPWVNLGLIHQQRGDETAAENAFNQAIAINANNLTAYNQLALLYRESGDFDQAEVLYQQALARWPHHPDSHRNLGILYDLYLGRREQALLHYRAYQQLQDEPDREVAGWIVDLERQLEAAP